MTLIDVLNIANDGIELQVNFKTDGVYIEIENDFCGSTETGFGATVGMDLNREEVETLYNFFKKCLEINKK